jgi:hypothetical protein
MHPLLRRTAWRLAQSFEDLHKLWFVLVKERNVLHTEKHIMRQADRRFVAPGRLKQVKLSMNRVKQVLGERQLAQRRTEAKKKSATLISSERTRMKHFLSELLLRKGPLSYAAIGAVLYQNQERERVIDSYGGVRAFVLQHKGTFLYKDVQIEVEDVLKGELRTYTTVCLEQSLVALRPVLAERLGAEDPPSIELLAPCWSQGLGAARPEVLPPAQLP